MEQKIESKLNKIVRFYDADALKTIFEPKESMLGVVGLELPRKKDSKMESSRLEEKTLSR